MFYSADIQYMKDFTCDNKTDMEFLFTITATIHFLKPIHKKMWSLLI